MIWLFLMGFTFVIGACLGSFANVLLYRLPRGENFVRSRSRCPFCRTQLHWFELIPLLSFLILRGRCRSCRRKISWRYFVVELTFGLFFLTVWLSFGPTWALAPLLAIGFFLLMMFWFDLSYLVLPDIFTVLLLGVSLVWRMVMVWSGGGLRPVILDSLSGAALLGGVSGFIWLISSGRWLGFGDVKLLAVFGVLFGPLGGSIVLYLACLSGGLIAIIMLVAKRANLRTKLPFGSFLTAAAMAYLMFKIPIDIFLSNIFIW